MIVNQQVNLFRPALSSRQSALSRGKVVLVVSAVVCAALAALGQSGYGAWQAHRNAQQLQLDLAAAESTLKTRQAELLQNTDGVDVAALEQAVIQGAVVAGTLETQMGGAQVSYAGVLVALARNVVPGVRLIAVRFANGVQQARIEGLALDPVRMTSYLTRLRADAALDGIELDGLKIGTAPPGGDAAVEFTVTSDAAEDEK